MVPAIECAHYSRLRILNETILNLQRCYHLYQSNRADTSTEPEQSAIYALSVGLEAYVQADKIQNHLAAV